MHAGAGFRDHARLAHAARQHDLAEHVVHLVRAGVIEVFALEIDFRAAEMLRHALGEIERRRPADIVREMAVHLRLERRIGLRLRIGLLEREDQRHQRLGDEAAAIDAEMPALVGAGAKRIRLLDGHARAHHVLLAVSRRRARGANEGADFVRVLFARRAFDARRHIDTGRARDAQRFGDIVRR